MTDSPTWIQEMLAHLKNTLHIFSLFPMLSGIFHFCPEQGSENTLHLFPLPRWVKFEEDVEEGGNRWSKPHVATLSLHSLFELRSLLLNGTVGLDINNQQITTNNWQTTNCKPLKSDLTR